MPEPQTEAGRALLAETHDLMVAAYALAGRPFRGPPPGAAALVEKYLPAIEAEAAAAEAERWRRSPGSYVTDRGLEIVVALPESLSWLEDEFPDEVAAVAKEARDAALAEAEAAVEGLHDGAGTTVRDLRGFAYDPAVKMRRAALAALATLRQSGGAG